MRIRLSRTLEAFTILELLVVVVVCLLALASLYPNLASRPNKRHVWQNTCVNNLKQVGLSFCSWAGDHGGTFPMHFRTNDFEGEKHASQQTMHVYFQVMSNYLGTPKVLACPSDRKKRVASDFKTNFGNSAVGYFVGLDARLNMSQHILAGDRNLTNETGLGGGIVEFSTNRIARIGWTEDMHERQGQIVMGDASVQKLTTARVREEIRKTGLATNQLVFP